MVDGAPAELLTYSYSEKIFPSIERRLERIMSHSLRYLANCSMLFTELPLLQRPAAAQSAGFSAVEFWWPFDSPVPGDAAADAFVGAVRDSGVRLVGLNFYAGDLAGPDCGVLSIPARSQQFRDNIDVAVGIGERLGVTGFNALYGVRVDGVTAERQDELAAANIAAAARAASSIGATVFVEPVSGPKPYPLRYAADAAAVVDRVRAAGAANAGILFDLYHLAANGEHIERAIEAYAAKIAHVQIADAPGRGEPGTGKLDLDGYLARLEQAGYAGWVGLEYKPTVPTLDSLAWLARERRAGVAGGTGASQREGSAS
jgi:hydroxypyruvate isomerase